MQATLDSASMKHVIKALTCLAKYGEDLMLYAASESLTFSCTNSSMSAYCRFKYSRQFFSRYHVDGNAENEETLGPTGQLNAKSLLSILKHRTVEKAVEKCEFSIVEGGAEADETVEEEDRDSLESKLIVRLHCKHGIVKTHRLLLNACTLVCPSMPDPSNESRISIVPKTLRDLLEHFPFPKGPKHDPKLIWKFAEEEIFLKGHETSLDANAKGQLATELSINSGEFDVYDIYDPPTTMCFHIREFQATLALAEALSLDMNMRFTDPSSPIFLEIDGDLSENLFVISTTQTASMNANANSGTNSNAGAQPRVQQSRAASAQPKGKKRALEQDQDDERGRDDPDDHWSIRDGDERPVSVSSSAKRKPMKAVVRADRASVTRELQAGPSNRLSQTMPPPSFIPPRASLLASLPRQASQPPPAPTPSRKGEPLFLPGSQLSQAAETAIRESGLGIENMDADEFAAMMEDEGEEFDVNAIRRHESATSVSVSWDGRGGESGADADVSMQETDDQDLNARESDSFDLYEEVETQFGPTQGSAGSAGSSSSKTFRPLFDD